MFSFVQDKIITRLISAGELRYSEIKPSDSSIADDLFNYHLQFLVKKGVVEKHGQLYRLSDFGKKISQSYDSRGVEKEFFKASVLAYVTRGDDRQREILLQKRIRHPFRGDIEVISGKINPGELIEDAASRKLQEEAGLIAVFKFLGVKRSIRNDRKGEIIEDSFYHVCHAHNPTGSLLPKTEFGENFWGTFSQANRFQKTNLVRSKALVDILIRIERGNQSLFYFQEKLSFVQF